MATRFAPATPVPGLSLAAGAVVGAAWGIAAGVWTPRGPLSTSEGLWAMCLSLLVGVLAGVLARSRWALLAAPLGFVVAFELTRLSAVGPMVDRVHLSQYGILALVTGRGFHGLLTIAPMMLGAVLGAALARRAGTPSSDEARPASVTRRTVTVLVAVALVALGALIARPASTSPIQDASGQAVPGSVAELTTFSVGEHDLRLMIRGSHVGNPVLLFLAGGPGGSELGAMRRHLSALEQHVVVATWDQRGTGKSYPELDPVETLSLAGYLADTLAVTDYLRERFGQDRIYLVGQSWGSTLGVLAARQAPEKYLAYVGAGQMVSQRETDRIFYRDTLSWARATGNEALAASLEDIGEPPYTSVLDYETALSSERQVYAYDRSSNSEGEGGFSENFLVREYTLLEQVHLLGAFMDTFSALYPQLQEIDFRATDTDFDIPVHFVQGAHEAAGRAALFEEWYPMISAPSKDVTYLETSGHRPLFEQPEAFVDYLVGTVLAETSSR